MQKDDYNHNNLSFKKLNKDIGHKSKQSSLPISFFPFSLQVRWPRWLNDTGINLTYNYYNVSLCQLPKDAHIQLRASYIYGYIKIQNTLI